VSRAVSEPRVRAAHFRVDGAVVVGHRADAGYVRVRRIGRVAQRP